MSQEIPRKFRSAILSSWADENSSTQNGEELSASAVAVTEPRNPSMPETFAPIARRTLPRSRCCENFLDNGKRTWLTARGIAFQLPRHANPNPERADPALRRVNRLTRRQVVLVPAAAYAQARFPGVAYRDYPACLPDYLRGLAASAREKRDREMAKLATPEAIAQRKTWARKTLLETIGGLPERSELKARTTGKLEREHYRVDKVVYESRPGFPVSANLYIPKHGQAHYPSVLFQLGHGLNGKAYARYQSACQGLVQLGFVVLSFDPMGQGERIYYPDADGVHSRLHDADLEHTVPGRQTILVGTSCAQFQLWDAIRSLDYLAAHPLVNPERLASAGQSGGATLTMLLAAVDERLHCAAEFSGNTENVACPDFIPPGATDDAEQNFVGSGPLGFDRWDLFYPFAPKPILISISDKDSFGTYSPNYVRDSWREYQRLASVYRTLGAPGNLAWTDTPLPHGLSYDSRLELYSFPRLHLMGEAQPVKEEPPVALETDERLFVSESGNLVKSLGGETPFTLTRKRFRERKKAPPIPLERLLKLERPRGERAAVLRKVKSARGVTVEALDVAPVASAGLPAWLFRGPETRPDAAGVLILNPRGRNAAWHEGELCQRLAERGWIVCATDVRGIGDLSPQVGSGAPGYALSHQKEEDYAWSSLILGRPLAGQRTTDILAIAGALRQLAGESRPLAIAALGALTVPAVFASAREPSIGSLYLAGGLASFGDILNEEDYLHPFANFVPDLPMHTDLPELVAAIAPRPVVLAGTVDGRGARMGAARAREAYRAAIALGHVTIEDEPGWNADALARWLAPSRKGRQVS